jgi:integrase
MPKRSSPSFIPVYQRHKPSGQARVRLNGRDHYLGTYGSKASREQYDRVIAEWMASGRNPLPLAGTNGPAGAGVTTSGLTVTELIARYWSFVEGYYCKNGEPSPEQPCIKQALKRLKRLYGPTPAAAFGPLELQAVRQTMIAEGLARRTVNGNTGRIRRCFKWGVAQAIVPPVVFQGLVAVTGLRAGRSEARETDPIGPVADAVVEATLPHLTPTVANMVRLQRLTGMRAGALCRLTRRKIDTSGSTWFYEDTDHKTAHHGKRAFIAIGPRAQELLRARFKADLDAPLFSPREAVAEHARQKRAERATPVTAAQARRDAARVNRSRRRKRPPGDCYDTAAYRAAIQRACDRAFPHPTLDEKPACQLTPAEQQELRQWRSDHRWHPHQLRHTYATEARRAGLPIEDVSAALNHSDLDTTLIYAERTKQQAARVAMQVG